ncbi:hypothetical protein [Thermofilum pendens]|nr:hypothetical protein [Thermofilum pendens]
MMVEFGVKGERVVVRVACLKSKSAVCPKDLVRSIQGRLPENVWVTLFDECRKIPPLEVVVSAVGYTVRGIMEGKTISRDPSLDVLLYVNGSRNIGEALKAFFSSCTESFGVVAFSLGREPRETAEALALFRELGFEESEPDLLGSLNFYSQRLGVPAEKVPGYMRARMVYLALEV